MIGWVKNWKEIVSRKCLVKWLIFVFLKCIYRYRSEKNCCGVKFLEIMFLRKLSFGKLRLSYI